MLTRFRQLSIKNKLTAIISVTSTIMVLLAMVTITVTEMLTLHQAKLQELSALAETIGTTTSAAIMFARPARRAPPASARNSRWRENHMTMIEASIPRISSAAI